MEFIGPIFFVLYILIILGVTLYVITLLSRFVNAHEEMARHLLEIARDFKTYTIEKDER